MTAATMEERVEHLYDRIAPRYDLRWQGYLQATHARTLQLLDPKPGEKILDASGGTGLLAEKLLDAVGPKGSVTIVDSSAGMLAEARRRLREYPNVVFIEGSIEALSVGAEYDRVVCANAFHHYVDPHAAVRSFRDALRPWGTLAITDWRDAFPFRLWTEALRLCGRFKGRVYSTAEMLALLDGFQVSEKKEWRYRWYPLFSIKAIKK